MQMIQYEFTGVCIEVVKDSRFNETTEYKLRNKLQVVFG